MRKIRFKGRNNSMFSADLHEVTCDDKNVCMMISVELETFDYILENHLFNLYEDRIKASLFMNFSSNSAIELELRLEPMLIEILELAIPVNPKGIEDYIISKSESDTDNIFVHNESWYVLKGIQQTDLPKDLRELGEVKTGFLTTWGEELDLR